MRIQFQSWSIPLIIPLFLVSRLTRFASLYDLQFQRKLVKNYAVRLLFVSQDGRTTLYLSSFLITYRTCCFGIDPCPKRRSRKIKKHLNSYIIIVCIIVHIKEGKNKNGFVLHMKWYFSQALRCYDYLHESLLALLAFSKSLALYSCSGIWHRDIVSTTEFKERDDGKDKKLRFWWINRCETFVKYKWSSYKCEKVSPTWYNCVCKKTGKLRLPPQQEIFVLVLMVLFEDANKQTPSGQWNVTSKDSLWHSYSTTAFPNNSNQL